MTNRVKNNAPTTLEILGKVFTVDYIEMCGLACEADGVICHSDQAIKVNKACHIERQKEVVLHEITHAIDRITVLGLDEDNTIRLSNALYTILKHNPKLVSWIMAD